ncbi:MAG: hypothetical protein ABI270_03565 [Nitrosospira sp.]
MSIDRVDRSSWRRLQPSPGLEEFAVLTDALTTAGATVQVASPPQVIISHAAANRQA